MGIVDQLDLEALYWVLWVIAIPLIVDAFRNFVAMFKETLEEYKAEEERDWGQ